MTSIIHQLTLILYHAIFECNYLKLSNRDSEIWLVEFIWNIPTQRSEFPPLLDQGVEEAEPKQKLAFQKPNKHWIVNTCENLKESTINNEIKDLQL